MAKLMPAGAEVKDAQPNSVCDLCGGPLRSTNTVGVCRRTPECDREQQRRRRGRPAQPVRTCDVCGGPLRSGNGIGVCRRTPECARERDRRRNQEPARRAYTLAYQATDEYRTYQAQYWLANKDHLTGMRTERAEELRQYSIEWRERNRDWVRAYGREKNRKRESLLRAVAFEPINERLLWELNQRTCYLCSAAVEFGRHHVDHIIPLSKGGTTVYENLAVVHPHCNIQKASKIITDPLADLRPVIAEMARKAR